MLKNFSKNKNYSGFSFIEAILAVFLIATGMIAVMSLMSSSLKDSMGSRDQIIGVLLSQEGIELVRNLRDNNWANGFDTFNSGAGGNFPAGNIANGRIDYDDIQVSPTGVFNLYLLNNNVYSCQQLGGSVTTKFKRKIQVVYDNLANKNTAEITSIVIWGGSFPASLNNCNSSAKCAYAKTTLTRWGGN